MIPRQIIGPQDRYERTGAQSLRDIRPLTARLSEALQSSASGLVLGMAAIGTFVEPAVVDLSVPAAMAYAAWVLTRRVRLPMRLPRGSGLPDYSNPTPGSRKAKTASGAWFVGWAINGQELWITPEDARQHMTIPGTTGAGKTTAIISLLVNALAQGSGFVLVDGKADRTLFGTVLGLARRFGREDDVRVLNFMVASGLKDSHTFNAFATGIHTSPQLPSGSGVKFTPAAPRPGCRAAPPRPPSGCPTPRSPLPGLPRLSARTGRSRTHPTTAGTSPWERTVRASAPIRAYLPACAVSLSTSSKQTGPTPSARTATEPLSQASII